MSVGGQKKSGSSKFSEKRNETITETNSSSSSMEKSGFSNRAKVINKQTESNLLDAQDNALAQSNYFTVDNAKADSKIAVDEAMRSVMQKYLPDLNQAVASSGAYGGTAQNMLSNDLAGRTAAAGAVAQGEYIKDYGTLNQQAANVIANLASQMGFEDNTTTGETAKTSKTTNKKKEATLDASGTGKSKSSSVGFMLGG